ncbi:uncharacterized protein LOC114323108 [Camellia sinensis]|uniref:uncharacterized protein LOC114323108 n=1 Tax=Camellia sinensis TaxID=4442 RepID=UPI001036E954|nr:uncharacterized protein LOC114323108 [Camellia sinensis]
MESESKKIEETVIEILKDADLEEATELKVRTMAAKRLGIDLSDLDHKWLVRRVVESYLVSLEEDKVEEQTKEVVVPEQGSKHGFDLKEASDGGEDRVISKLSEKRRVAVRDFRGNTLVSIRDYFQKDGKLLPSGRGISLNAKQWSAFRKSVPDIEAAITKMESQRRSKGAGKQIEADMSNSVTAVAQEIIPAETKRIEEDISNSVAASAPQHQELIPEVTKQSETDISNSVAASAPQSQVQFSTETKRTEADISNSVIAAASQPQGLVPIQTTRLDGKNYHCWVHQMEFFLKQLKVAYVLTEPCPSIAVNPEASFEEIALAKAAVQKWVDDDYISRHTILNSLSDHLFAQYSKKTRSAKELWEELKLAYDEDVGTKRSQVNKYIQFQMVDGIPILEQVQELHMIADSIIASGMWVDENFHVSAIISKLPSSWKEYRMKLMREEFLPLKMLMYRLSVEEESRNRAKEEVSLLKADNKLGPKTRDNKVITCYNCGEKGHISKNCHFRKVFIR